MNIFNFLNNDKKKVKFNKNVSLILIPSKDEVIDQIGFDQLWYRPEDYLTMKHLFTIELQVIAYQQNISMRESLHFWSYNSSVKQDQAITE
jgi:hypothetical protein